MTARTYSPLGSVLLLALFAQVAPPARAQVVDPNMWVTNGTVYATALVGDTLYIGGSFTRVVPQTGGLARLDSASGYAAASWPRVVGTLSAVASDGSGGWYVGGSFTSVGGVARQNLAHILADGSLAGWNPGASNTVYDLAVSGNTVYAGGSFTSIGGQARNLVAALDATTGLATAWNPGAGGNYVFDLAVSGNTVYAGGYFTSIGGQPRSHIAALDATTGLATTWNPGADGEVYALAVSGNTVYAGGGFTSIGGLARNRIAALDATTGLAMAWNPGATGGTLPTVYALAVSGNTVYAGGSFTSIGGQSRSRIAALDGTTGLATAWNPGANDYVHELAVNGATVYAGGGFTNIGGQVRNRIAALDATTGLATAWNPDANERVLALAVSGNTVCAGGWFTTIGGLVRNYLAALNVETGQPTAWNPGANKEVYALSVSGNTVYAGGFFTSIGGLARNRIAALDATTGLAMAWNPAADGSVSALAVSGNTVYAGGSFLSIGGQVRWCIAALDATTGLATAWNPRANGGSYTTVGVLAVSGTTVYAGGNFSSIGGQPRSILAALDATTGQALAWNPAPSGFASATHVSALAVSGGVLYIGGAFSSIGGLSRGNVAAVDVTSSQLTGWAPEASADVYALAVTDSIVYAGGLFTSIGGQARSRIAAVSATTGQALAWNPGVSGNGKVYVLAAGGNTMYAGGTFTGIGGRPASCIARILPAPSGPPTIAALSPNGGESLTLGSVRTLAWQATADAPGIQSVDLYVSRSGPSGPWELIAAALPNTGAREWTVAGPLASGTCYLRVDARDWAGTVISDVSDAAFSIVSLTNAPGPRPIDTCTLSAPVPNPAHSGGAVITYALSQRGQVRLSMLDVLGREVAVLAASEHEPGRYAVTIATARLPAGLYFVRLRAPGKDLRRRLVVMR